MSRITAINPRHAQGSTKAILDPVTKMLGATPNMFRVAARSQPVLNIVADTDIDFPVVRAGSR